jgi:hypothetical protein
MSTVAVYIADEPLHALSVHWPSDKLLSVAEGGPGRTWLRGGGARTNFRHRETETHTITHLKIGLCTNFFPPIFSLGPRRIRQGIARRAQTKT